MAPLYGSYKGVMETSLYKPSPYLPFHMTLSFCLKKYPTFPQISSRDVSMTPLYGTYKGVMETSPYVPYKGVMETSPYKISPYLPFSYD